MVSRTQQPDYETNNIVAFENIKFATSKSNNGVGIVRINCGNLLLKNCTFIIKVVLIVISKSTTIIDCTFEEHFNTPTIIITHDLQITHCKFNGSNLQLKNFRIALQVNISDTIFLSFQAFI